MDVNTAFVLIVDDEPEIRESLREYLNLSGIPTLEASSGNEAIAMLRRYSIIAVLTDNRMSDGTGVDLLTKMRGAGIRIPVVFITSSDERELMKRAIQLGAFDFIMKPFSFDEVVKVAQEARAVGIKIKSIDNELFLNVPSEKQNENILKHMHEITTFNAKRLIAS